jgi:hypothetical protein
VALAITAIPLALAQSPTVFFSPLDGVYRPRLVSGSGGYSGSVDYLDLFSPNAPWANAASRVHVFEPYGQWIVAATDAQIMQMIADLGRRHIDLGMEVAAFSATPTCGAGVETFAAEANPQVLNRIKNLGGTLRYILFDSALYFGSMYDGPNACHWSTATILDQLLSQIAIVKSVFPDALVGDIEALAPHNVPDWLERYREWIRMYREATGSNFATVRADLGGYQPNWRNNLMALSELVTHEGIPFGIIYQGSDEKSNAEWMNSAREHILDYELHGGRPPDQVVFQSWTAYPKANLPETDPSAFTSIINWYSRQRTVLSAKVDASLISGSLTDSQGAPLASAAIQVTATSRAGQGRIRSYTVTGTVPDGMRKAVAGIRVNVECGCRGTNDVTLYNFKYTESSRPNRMTTLDFSKRLKRWRFGRGAATLEPGPPPLGPGLHVAARPDQAVLLNSLRFKTTPGAFFTLKITARVSPDSVGSGYFMIVFLPADGRGELSRQTLAFQRETVSLGTANTAADGSYSVSLPAEDPNSYEIQARYSGDDTYWPAVASLLGQFGQAQSAQPPATSCPTTTCSN